MLIASDLSEGCSNKADIAMVYCIPLTNNIVTSTTLFISLVTVLHKYCNRLVREQPCNKSGNPSSLLQIVKMLLQTCHVKLGTCSSNTTCEHTAM